MNAWGTTCFWSPTDHEQRKHRKFKKQIGRMENMTYDADEDCFLCTQGRRLPLRRECTELQDGCFVTTARYRCEDCRGCPVRAQCCQAKDPEQPKELRVNKTLQHLRNQSLRNITSEKGIYLRICRSIQVEGAFGAKIRSELFFLALAFDLKKLWMKRENGRLQTHLSRLKAA